MRNERRTLAQRLSAAKRDGRGRKGVEETPERSFSCPFAITDLIRPLCPPFSAFGLILDAYFAREGGRDWWRGIGNSGGQEKGEAAKDGGWSGMGERVGKHFFLTSFPTPSEPQSTSFAITRPNYASRLTCDVHGEASCSQWRDD
ncbi:hypothetical protein BT69DRAFT_74947 [Atractiella rhizophila]|nr:hypothetical protein BT69DRAFT_74947 [Atractiella rhizophila]